MSNYRLSDLKSSTLPLSYYSISCGFTRRMIYKKGGEKNELLSSQPLDIIYYSMRNFICQEVFEIFFISFSVQNPSGASMLMLAPATEHPSNAEMHSVPTGIIKHKRYRNNTWNNAVNTPCLATRLFVHFGINALFNKNNVVSVCTHCVKRSLRPYLDQLPVCRFQPPPSAFAPY